MYSFFNIRDTYAGTPASIHIFILSYFVMEEFLLCMEMLELQKEKYLLSFFNDLNSHHKIYKS